MGCDMPLETLSAITDDESLRVTHGIPGDARDASIGLVEVSSGQEESSRNQRGTDADSRRIDTRTVCWHAPSAVVEGVPRLQTAACRCCGVHWTQSRVW